MKKSDYEHLTDEQLLKLWAQNTEKNAFFCRKCNRHGRVMQQLGWYCPNCRSH